MKTIKTRLILLFVALFTVLTFVSCSDEEENTDYIKIRGKVTHIIDDCHGNYMVVSVINKPKLGKSGEFTCGGCGLSIKYNNAIVIPNLREVKGFDISEIKYFENSSEIIFEGRLKTENDVIEYRSLTFCTDNHYPIVLPQYIVHKIIK